MRSPRRPAFDVSGTGGSAARSDAMAPDAHARDDLGAGVDPAAAADLLRSLRDSGYAFVAPTPETTRRVVRRPELRRARTVRDVFGWSRPGAEEALDEGLFDTARRAGLLRRTRAGWRARVRISSLGGRLFLHSAYPALGERTVFFGPDTYRFAAFVAAEAEGGAADRIVDVGGGCGGGAISLAARLGAPALVTDVNPAALALARINAAAAGVKLETALGSGLEPAGGGLRLVIANPPYVAGAGRRAYRYGGEMLGAALSLQWALEGADRLAPGGRMLLYTGSAIVDGRDGLAGALEPALRARGCRLSYRELDPDVFGDLLATAPYRRAERIAVVGAVIVKL